MVVRGGDRPITVISAIYGGYDTPKPISQGAHRWLMVTDSQDTAEAAERVGWEPLIVASNHPPRLAAQLPKTQPHLFCEEGKSVWADGGLTLAEGTVTWAVNHLDRQDWLAMFTHPNRDCVYTEAEFSATRPKYDADTLTAQADAYRREGHPQRWGLWCGTFFAVRHTTRQAEFGAAWLTEIAKWQTNDQVSLPVVLRRMGHRPVEFSGHLYRSRMFTLTDHG